MKKDKEIEPIEIRELDGDITPVCYILEDYEISYTKLYGMIRTGRIKSYKFARQVLCVSKKELLPILEKEIESKLMSLQKLNEQLKTRNIG